MKVKTRKWHYPAKSKGRARKDKTEYISGEAAPPSYGAQESDNDGAETLTQMYVLTRANGRRLSAALSDMYRESF